jgi:hypothetical protein
MGGPMLHAQIALPAAAPLINTARTLSPRARRLDAPQRHRSSRSRRAGWRWGVRAHD